MSLNIKGDLHAKVHSTCIRSLMSNHDIMCFSHAGHEPVGQIPGYRIYHLSRIHDPVYGGVAIAVSNHVAQHCKIVRSHADMGMLWLCLTLPRCTPLYIACCYLPPVNSTYYKNTNMSIKLHFDTLQSDITYFSNLGKIIVCGDLNCRTGGRADTSDIHWEQLSHFGVPSPHTSNITNLLRHLPPRLSRDQTLCPKMGSALLNLCQSSQLVILNGRLRGDLHPTTGGAYTFYGPPRRPRGSQPNSQPNSNQSVPQSLIDYFIASPDLAFGLNGHSKPNASITVARPSSLINDTDHAYLSLTLDPPIASPQDNTTPPQTKRYKYRPEIMQTLVETLTSHPFTSRLNKIGSDGMTASSCISEFNDALSDALHIVHSKCGGVIACPTQTTNLTHLSKSWYNADCVAAREIWKSTTLVHGATSDETKSARNAYRNTARQARHAFEDKVATEMTRTWQREPRAFWRMYKSSQTSCPLTDVDTWADYFNNLFNGSTTTTDQSPHADHLYPPPMAMDIMHAATLNNPITENEVYEELCRLQRHKSPGLDGFPAEFFIPIDSSRSDTPHPPPQTIFAPILTSIFNIILEGIYPATFSTATVTPVPKPKGNPLLYTDYRGIAVGSTLSKIFSMVLNSRADKWAEAQNLRAAGQFGFRRQRGTVEAAFVLRHTIERHNTNSKPI